MQLLLQIFSKEARTERRRKLKVKQWTTYNLHTGTLYIHSLQQFAGGHATWLL